MKNAPQFSTEEAPVEGVDHQIPRQPGAHNLAPQFMAPPAPEHDDYEDDGVDVGYLTNDGMFHVGNPEEPEPAEPRTTDPPVLQLRTARKEARKQQLADNAAAEPATPKLKAPKSAKKAAASTSEEPQADTTEPETTAPKAAKKGDNKGKGHKNGKGTAEAAPVAVKTAEQEKTAKRNGLLARIAMKYLQYREAKSATVETTKEERRKKVAAKVGQATVQKETEITPKVDKKGIRQALTVEQASMLSREEGKLVREELAQQRLINGLTEAELKKRLEKSGYFKVNDANVKRMRDGNFSELEVTDDRRQRSKAVKEISKRLKYEPGFAKRIKKSREDGKFVAEWKAWAVAEEAAKASAETETWGDDQEAEWDEIENAKPLRSEKDSINRFKKHLERKAAKEARIAEKGRLLSPKRVARAIGGTAMATAVAKRVGYETKAMKAEREEAERLKAAKKARKKAEKAAKNAAPVQTQETTPAPTMPTPVVAPIARNGSTAKPQMRTNVGHF